MFISLLCSVWSWSALPSPTGVLSSWSTVGNATRTWLTLWEPTLWVWNCPLRTSSLARISSGRPGSSSDILSNPCRRHTGTGADHLFFSSPCLFLLSVLASFLCSRFHGNRLHFVSLLPFVVPPASLSSVREEWPPGWSSHLHRCFAFSSWWPLPPHMITDHSWTRSQGSLFC